MPPFPVSGKGLIASVSTLAFGIAAFLCGFVLPGMVDSPYGQLQMEMPFYLAVLGSPLLGLGALACFVVARYIVRGEQGMLHLRLMQWIGAGLGLVSLGYGVWCFWRFISIGPI